MIKRRPRQSWATRPLPPLTLEELDRHLDLVAELMIDLGKEAHLLLPIWKRVNQERDRFVENQSALDAARARLAARAAQRVSS